MRLNPFWYLARPQQALFQGSKAGSQAVAKGMSSGNPFESDVFGAIRGAANYIPAFAKGAWKGLTGQGPDVSGAELVEGLGGDSMKPIENYVGTALDLTADPSALGGNVLAKIPNVMKTASAIRALQGTKAGQFLSELSPAAKYLGGGTSITHLPEEGLTYLGKKGDVESIARAAEGAGYSLLDAINPMSKTSGFYNPDAGVIAYDIGSRASTLPHERTHWLMDKAQQLGSDAWNWMKQEYRNPGNPDLLAEIDKTYDNPQVRQLMDEYFAHATERGIDMGPTFMRQMQRQARNVPQELLGRNPFEDARAALALGFPATRAADEGMDYLF